MSKICINVSDIDMKEDIITFDRGGGVQPFYVSMCGISYCDGSYIVKRPESDIYVIEYIVSGTGTVKEDDKISYPGEGDVYLLKRGRNHIYYSDGGNPWTKIWINFEGELADAIIKSYGLSDKMVFYAPELKEYFNEIYRISRSGTDKKIISDRIAVVFLQIVQRLADCDGGEADRVSTLAESIKNKIDDITDFKTTLDDIVKLASYSKCHIIREFKASYGLTPYEYMLKRRFYKAKIMIKNTAMSISDISEELGFCDVHYFSSSFSKRFGVSPSEYRKLSRTLTSSE